MDIKFTTSKLNAYWNAVKDCDTKSASRLARNIENGSLTLEQGGRLEDREIGQLSPEEQAKYKLQNNSARAMLLQSLSDELDDLGLTGSARVFADQYLAGLRIKLDGPGKHGDPTFTNGSALDGRDVKQILSHFETVKDQASGLMTDKFSSWNIGDYDPDNPGELEWQSVVRGHNDAVRPNGRQTDLLVYGKCAALVKAMGITPEQSDQIDLTDFAQKPDGTITCKARRDGAVVDELTLDTDGVLTAESRSAEIGELEDTISVNCFAAFGIKRPATAFQAADLKEITSFLKFYAKSAVPDTNYEGVTFRRELFNMLPDALDRIHDLRRNGKLKGNSIPLSTWWTSIGLKGKFPGGAADAQLAEAFSTAVQEKVVDDFLDAKGWSGIKGMKAWFLSTDMELETPCKWPKTFLTHIIKGFYTSDGYSHSQRLRLATSADLTKEDLKSFFRPDLSDKPIDEATAFGLTTRGTGIKVSHPLADEPFVVSGSEVIDQKLFKALLDQGFTSQQAKRVLDIPNAAPDAIAGIGILDDLHNMSIDVKRSGEDLLLTIRMPVDRALEGKDALNVKIERTDIDRVAKYVVRPNGAYEQTELTFEKAPDRASSRQFESAIFGNNL